MRGTRSSLETYWRRRKYHRLNKEGKREKTKKLRRRRFFHVGLSPALAFLRRRVTTPRRVLVFLRDAYVKLMLRIANSGVVAGGGGGFGFYGVAAAPPPFGRLPAREYDEKMILKMYNVLLKEGKLGPLANGGEIVLHRPVSL